MIKYIIKRLLLGAMVLFGVVTIVFFLFNIMPGDSARLMLGQRADKESLKVIQADLGIDKPLSTQYMMFINDLSPISFHSNTKESAFYLSGNKYDYITLARNNSWFVVLKIPYLRKSYQTKQKVGSILYNHIGETALLAFSAILFASLLGVFFGVISAVFKDRLVDRTLLVFSTLGMSIPSFYSAILISWIFGFLLSHYTGLSMTGSLFEYNDLGTAKIIRLDHLILPSITLGIRPVSSIMQLTRNSMLDVLNQNYIVTAQAKGLSYWSVTIKHGLRNALNPVFTSISGMFASLMAGALFVENIFAWKGIGWLLYEALTKFDLPLVMGGVILSSSIFVVINIIVDISYRILDPRISLN